MIPAMISPKVTEVKQFLLSQLGARMHAKRLSSLSDAVTGVIASQTLQVSKQFCQATYFSKEKNICCNGLDGICKRPSNDINVPPFTKHGRATPLLWKTISTVGLKGHKNGYVFMLFEKLRRIIPNDTQVVIIADREFGTLNNMEILKEKLNFDYILRVKRNFTITDHTKTIKKLAHEWLDCEKLTCIDDGYMTVQEYQVNKIVICKEAGMKDMWCVTCSIKNIATQTIIRLYGKRWGTETSYRDEKDLQFGFGLKKSRIKNVARRDRLLLLSAIAIIFLTLVGAASEEVGFDKYLNSNTVITRTHSLFA